MKALLLVYCVMKIHCFGLLLSFLATCSVVGAFEKGDVVVQHDFEGITASEMWNTELGPLVQLVANDKGGQALRIERKLDTAPSTMVRIELPAQSLRGSKIRIKATVKAENISAPPSSWNGIKVMLNTQGPSGNNWPQQNLPQGTFYWRAANYVASIPNDAERALIILGLEAVTGTVWFDDVIITIESKARPRPPTPPTGPYYKGHNSSRLRGAMIGANLKEKDFRDLAAWKANHVRWQLIWNGFPHSPADDADVAAYDAWLESALIHLDSMLPLCRQLGLHILLDLHTPPGGRNPEKQCRMFQEKRFQDAFLMAWEKMARRYKDESIIWGYDLVNEPVDDNLMDGLMDWRDLAIVATQRIRAIDPDHAIIIEAAPWGGPNALADFEPLPIDKIVYSFHMYEPGEFTHQNVYDDDASPIAYPGKIRGDVWWDKEQLRRVMQPVLEWQRDYNVHIYVGEFSAIRWAPGDSAHAYLRDLIDLFEENEWDWAYHAFREWPGWSVEH
ncbi:unnamed protein product, partial [Didymodactylos carnosus]